MQEIFFERYNIFNMENAEDVMQLLEEFSKIKPKDIPRELDEYLGYVAKTGDPVFQWSLIRNLLREKLLAVVTDFYESTLTVELPPCPNVDPFNYDRMKTSLLERFDAFTGAPFTIQRICELLINPRKEYNRADKYMRAIEKNILVVSTREPGTGKRPLECDQSDNILNGMPDVKLNESDGSLLHVPTDLPYFGAPPASNDVTIETTEPNSNIVDRIGSGINGDVNDESDKVCSIQESQKSSVDQDTLQVSSRVDLQNEDVPLDIDVKNVEENDCDSNNRLSNIAGTFNSSIDTEHDTNDKEIASETLHGALPDSIDSSNSPKQECSNSSDALTNDITNAEIEGLSDENEVSSSPANLPDDVTVSQVITNETTDSEAEAIDSCLAQDSENEANSSPDSHDSISEKASLEHETQISITEVTATRSDEIDLECNEISGTVSSPLSSDNAFTEQCDEHVELKNNVECDEESETNAHPDSSNDLCQNKLQSNEAQTCDKDAGSEADSHSEENLDHSLKLSHDTQKVAPDQTEDNIAQEISNESLPKEEATAKTVESSSSPVSIEDTAVSEGPSSLHAKEDDVCVTSKVAQPDVESTSDVVVEMYDNERRDESVIHSIPHIAQDEIAIEEICVDPSCEADEEAMDVDDGSNQMMVSEGENEAEPMDEGDQLQS